jgi:hypothetical protein
MKGYLPVGSLEHMCCFCLRGNTHRINAPSELLARGVRESAIEHIQTKTVHVIMFTGPGRIELPSLTHRRGPGCLFFFCFFDCLNIRRSLANHLLVERLGVGGGGRDVGVTGSLWVEGQVRNEHLISQGRKTTNQRPQDTSRNLAWPCGCSALWQRLHRTVLGGAANIANYPATDTGLHL